MLRAVLDLLPVLLYGLLALCGFGFVIAIHEFGHFVFAKWAGVRVDVFSIGFGPVLLRRRIGETDFVLSLLPLGGYVRMLGQEDVPTGSDQVTADPASYLAKPAGWRALILLGGVVFNLVSSYLILLGLAAWGMPLFRPVVGDVAPVVIDQHGLPVESPAARLGLKRGDLLLAVDGEQVRSFDDVMTQVLFAGGRPLTVQIERAGARLTLPAPGSPPVEPVFESRFGRPSLGVEPPYSGRVVALFDAPADGLRRFDRIVAIAGQDVSALVGQDLEERLLVHLGRRVPVTVLRDGERVELDLVYAGDNGAFDVRAGLPVAIAALPPGSPAAAAGLRVGDWILAVDGTAVCGQSHFMALVRAGVDARGGCVIAVLRDGARVEATVRAEESFGVHRIGVGPRSAASGVLGVLPPALDGSPGLLERTGLRPGDALVAWRPGENDVTIAWVSGGTARLLPLGLDGEGWKQANRYREPGLIGKILGEQPLPGLAARLSGTRVAELHPTAVVLQPPQGPARTVERHLLGPAAADLAVDDWICDARLADGRAVIEVVRGAGPVRTATLAPPPLGTALFFAPEEQPYQTQGVGDAFDLVNDTAYNLVVKGVMLIPRLFRSPEQGGVDPNKSLMGPIGIFRAMKERAELMGFDSFLRLVALVGLNLFVVNLLPIPITDGGQLLMLGFETAIRRPLPMWLRNGLMWIGLVLVALLFLYIGGLDILRWIGIA